MASNSKQETNSADLGLELGLEDFAIVEAEILREIRGLDLLANRGHKLLAKHLLDRIDALEKIGLSPINVSENQRCEGRPRYGPRRADGCS